MGLFNTKVKVQFINASDGNVIGISELPLNQLPETFEIETTMDLGGEKWMIANASPSKKSEFSQSKSLLLTMNKVEMVDVNDINYTLPTISNELPPLTQNASFNAANLHLLEDDWRQLEFLPKSSLEEIESERVFIKDIWDHHSKAIDRTFNAFSKIHVREIIGIPSIQVSLQELTSILKTQQIENLTIGKPDHFVENGFAIKLGTFMLYGTLNEDIIQSLCVDKINNDSEKIIHQLNSSFNLIFVNWYYNQIID